MYLLALAVSSSDFPSNILSSTTNQIIILSTKPTPASMDPLVATPIICYK